MADNEKPSNPKDSVGIKKAPMSCVSAPFMLGMGVAMMEGALKYGRHNYRDVGVRSSVYYDALMRHMMAWYEGEDIDPESGLSHLLKAGACLAVVYDSMHRGNLNDDRPPRCEAGWQQDLNAVAGSLVDKYPEPKLAHTHRDQTWHRQLDHTGILIGERKLCSHGKEWPLEYCKPCATVRSCIDASPM